MKRSRNHIAILVGSGALLAGAGVLVWAVQMGNVTGRTPRSAVAAKPPVEIHAASAAPSEPTVLPDQASRVQPGSVLTAVTIALHSDGELMLKDSSGRRTGIDSLAKKSVNEIPNVTYSNESIDDPNDDSPDAAAIEDKNLDMRPPQPGAYTLTIYSPHDGAYDLELRSASGTSLARPIVLQDVLCSAGSVQSFSLLIPPAGGSPEISGAFQQAKQENELLSYASPLAASVTLPPNTKSVPLIIFYGKDSDPSTFSATLNGAQITRDFHPAATRFESVQIPLQSGSNVLELQIAGAGSAAGVHANDRFVFVVGSE